MNSNAKLDPRLILTLGWVALGTIGDELFAWMYFQDPEIAFGFNLDKSWWWVYQVVLAITFGLLYSLTPRQITSKSDKH